VKILHVAATYLPARRYGGTIVSVHGLCRALAGRGHDVQVFTTNVDGSADSAVSLSSPTWLDGVRVRYFTSPFLRRIYWSPSMAQALAREVGTFDVVHLHALFVWPMWAAARLARRAGVPYVVAPRGMLEKDLIARKSPWLKSILLSAVVRRALEKSACIHVTSAREATEAEAFGYHLPAIREIPNGVDLRAGDDEAAGPAAPRDEWSALGPYLLFLGRVSWKKGLDRLISALALAPGLRLVVAGADEEGTVGRLMVQSQRDGVSDRVRFIGQVDGAKKQHLLKGAHLLVLPSYSENFGNVVLEAMAVGCPVVVTPEVGAGDLVRRSGAGRVVDGAPAALAAALVELSSDGSLRRAMAARGRLAARDYDWDAVARRMEVVYQEVRS
jgi:glycosyltransferase involved in cell wall biosynthesis